MAALRPITDEIRIPLPIDTPSVFNPIADASKIRVGLASHPSAGNSVEDFIADLISKQSNSQVHIDNNLIDVVEELPDAENYEVGKLILNETDKNFYKCTQPASTAIHFLAGEIGSRSAGIGDGQTEQFYGISLANISIAPPAVGIFSYNPQLPYDNTDGVETQTNAIVYFGYEVPPESDDNIRRVQLAIPTQAFLDKKVAGGGANEIDRANDHISLIVAGGGDSADFQMSPTTITFHRNGVEHTVFESVNHDDVADHEFQILKGFANTIVSFIVLFGSLTEVDVSARIFDFSPLDVVTKRWTQYPFSDILNVQRDIGVLNDQATRDDHRISALEKDVAAIPTDLLTAAHDFVDELSDPVADPAPSKYEFLTENQRVPSPRSAFREIADDDYEAALPWAAQGTDYVHGRNRPDNNGYHRGLYELKALTTPARVTVRFGQYTNASGRTYTGVSEGASNGNYYVADFGEIKQNAYGSGFLGFHTHPDGGISDYLFVMKEELYYDMLRERVFAYFTRGGGIIRGTSKNTQAGGAVNPDEYNPDLVSHPGLLVSFSNTSAGGTRTLTNVPSNPTGHFLTIDGIRYRTFEAVGNSTDILAPFFNDGLDVEIGAVLGQDHSFLLFGYTARTSDWNGIDLHHPSSSSIFESVLRNKSELDSLKTRVAALEG